MPMGGLEQAHMLLSQGAQMPDPKSGFMAGNSSTSLMLVVSAAVPAYKGSLALASTVQTLIWNAPISSAPVTSTSLLRLQQACSRLAPSLALQIPCYS
eukprot:scaffold75040_cov19-Tisochrysis_lutea.AAC.1